MNRAIKTPKAPAAIGPYSQGITATPFMYLSGQIPLDPETGLMPEGIKAQTHQVFSNIQAVINEAELSLNNIVKVTVFLKDMNDFAAVNEIYAEYFIKPYPARSAVEVSALPKGALIEIECIAHSTLIDNKNKGVR